MPNKTIPSTHSTWLIPTPDPKPHFPALTLLSDRPTPSPRRGEVLVRVKAVSLNYRDLVLAKMKYWGEKDNLIPCSDGAGEVAAVGEDVTDWKVGDRVMGQFTQSLVAGAFDEDRHLRSALGGQQDGMLTEYKILPDYGLVRIPEHLSFEEASTLPCAGLTAWNALHGGQGENRLLPGQTVVLQGTGGVSCFGAQFSLLSSAQILITSSQPSKLDTLMPYLTPLSVQPSRAIHTHNYKTDPDWDKKVLEITDGAGAEHILEVGGPGTIEKSFGAIKRGGSITTIGFVGSTPDTVNPNIAFLALSRGATFRGLVVGTRRQFEQMCAAITLTQLRPVIGHVFPFAQAREAYEALEAQTYVGKVVISVGSGSENGREEETKER